jgi:CO/xanthine dehydrogenase FAD-binding subunit
MALPLPGLPGFDYIRAESAKQVTDLLLKHSEDARLLMGGTDILVQMRNGECNPKLLVDLKYLPGFTSIEFDPEDGLSLGAAATMNSVSQNEDVINHYPLLADAANTVGSYQLRNRATVGGNLCNASPAADTAPVALVLDARLIVNSPKKTRGVPVDEFFQGPGLNSLKPGEFLSCIEFQPPPVDWQGRYLKLGRNLKGDLSITSVAVLGYPDQSAESGYRFRIALGSVAPTPIRVPSAEEILFDNPITSKTIQDASEACMEAASPIDDVRASARYRKAMTETLTRRALTEVWAMLGKGD